MRLGNIFKIKQGHQITDYEIYSSEGSIPIYTGENNLKGYWNQTYIEESELPCLTYATKAFAGGIFLQKDIFDANNIAVLVPDVKWKEKIKLEWFIYRLPKFFFQAMTSKEGVSYLNKELVEEIDIDVPSLEKQEREINYYLKLNEIRSSLDSILNKCQSLLEKSILIDKSVEDQVVLNEIFDYVSRNDSLSEEGIYRNSTFINSVAGIKVLSGGTDKIEYGEIAENTPDIHFLKNRQCLHLVTRGQAGKLTYVPVGNYATNTNAFLLFLKEESFKKLNINNSDDEQYYLKFMKLYLEAKFLTQSSFADVAVFPLTEVMESMTIPFFELSEEIKSIVDKYDHILNTFNYYKKILDRIDILFSKDIQ